MAIVWPSSINQYLYHRLISGSGKITSKFKFYYTYLLWYYNLLHYFYRKVNYSKPWTTRYQNKFNSLCLSIQKGNSNVVITKGGMTSNHLPTDAHFDSNRFQVALVAWSGILGGHCNAKNGLHRGGVCVCVWGGGRA